MLLFVYLFYYFVSELNCTPRSWACIGTTLLLKVVGPGQGGGLF